MNCYVVLLHYGLAVQVVWEVYEEVGLSMVDVNIDVVLVTQPSTAPLRHPLHPSPILCLLTYL